VTDVWSSVADLDAAVQDRLAGVLETRGSDAQQQGLRALFLADVELPDDAHVLDVGCGTGVLTRVIARREGVGSVVGVDLAPKLVHRARELAGALANVRYEVADAHSLPFGDASFDAVVFDSVLTHVPAPDEALAEAFRVLRPGGRLGVLDGDYATTTVALGDHDPLQRCVDAMMAGSVTDRWLVRRLPVLVRAAGFDVERFRSHGFVEAGEAAYMLTIVDRGADLLHARGQLGEAAAAALKDEARRRVEAGTFFGHIAYAGLVGSRPS
jgi:ubiquinone/menaquinone biosynthesis C-methylase UbiE